MLKVYPAIFHIAEEGGYWVKFPDFGGATEGDDINEAMNMAREFLEGHLAACIDMGKEFPEPTDIKILEVENGFSTLIQGNPLPYVKGNKTIRKNVTVPEWLAKKAEKENINFSETLTDALLEKVAM